MMFFRKQKFQGRDTMFYEVLATKNPFILQKNNFVFKANLIYQWKWTTRIGINKKNNYAVWMHGYDKLKEPITSMKANVFH